MLNKLILLASTLLLISCSFTQLSFKSASDSLPIVEEEIVYEQIPDPVLDDLGIASLRVGNDFFESAELAFDLTKDTFDEKQYDMPVVITPRVRAYLKVYTKTYPKTFQRWLDRSNKYIYLAKDIFRREGLPEDLVCLAFAESGFNPHAYSRVGAGGMWQFMPATGKEYGLKISEWVDERRDFEEATVASARFLKYLHNYFNDWYLAIAAYNAGFYKVHRAMKMYKTNDFFEIAKHRYLKRETKDYVPKFLALMIIHKNYLKYGFTPPAAAPLLYDRVELSQPVNLYVVAKLLDTDVNTLKDLNPALKTPITPPNDGYVLKVPYGTKIFFEEKMASMSPDELLQVKIYKARKGQSLKRIAQKYGSSVSEIKKINGIRYNKMLYHHTIFVPIKKYFDYSSYQKFAKDVRKEAPKVHVVKRGDNFYDIAHKYGLSVYDLVRLNQGMNPRLIHPGQAIVVSYDYKGKKKKRRKKKSYAKKRSYKLSAGKYVVKSGDTLWDIASHFKVPVNTIMANNHMTSHKLKPGKILIINN